MTRRRLTAARLIELVGRAAAERLMEDWGGHQLPQLPADYAARTARDRRLHALLKAGATYRAAARELGISTAHAARIASRPVP